MRKIDSSWILVIVFILLFIIWSILVVKGVFLFLDYQIFDFIQQYLINDFLVSFFKAVTYLGSASILFFITIISLLIFKNKHIGISLGINAFLIAMLNLILKNLFLIPRPEIVTLIEENGYSFPSGHAMASFSFYGYLIYLIYKKMKPSVVKNILLIFLVLLIFLIGFSRIYLGVHHFSDIIGGYIISGAYLILYIKLVKKLGLE